VASAGRGEPRCSFEIADKIVTLLQNDEEARSRWNTLLGRGISASMRDTFLAYRNGRRGEYYHVGAAKRTTKADSNAFTNFDRAIAGNLLSKLSRARIVS